MHLATDTNSELSDLSDFEEMTRKKDRQTDSDRMSKYDWWILLFFVSYVEENSQSFADLEILPIDFYLIFRLQQFHFRLHIIHR